MTKREDLMSIISVKGPTSNFGKFLPEDQLLSFLLGILKASPMASDNNSKYTKKPVERLYCKSALLVNHCSGRVPHF